MANYPTTVVRAVALLALALVLAACGTKANPNPKTFDSYVAMGDSYTAVAGVGPYSDSGCRRGVHDYPSLVAQDLGIKNFTDASCGGATSDALTQEQTLTDGGGVRQPQMGALNSGTKLVTLGIGLNDSIGGSSPLSYAMLYLCTQVNGVVNPLCASYLQIPESAFNKAIKAVAQLVKGNLEAIKKAAPNARVILVGYPRVLADDADCPAQLPMSADAAQRLRYGLQLVNTEYAKIAKQSKVDYIDMWSASKGHDLCASTPWVNGLFDLPGKALQFHPYEAYHRAVADKIVALLKK